MKSAAVIGAAAAAIPALPLLTLLAFAPSASAASAGPEADNLGATMTSVICSLTEIQVGDPVPGGTLGADQYANAAAIYAEAVSAGESDQAPLDAILASIGASNLHLNPGSRPADDVGLFGFKIGQGGQSVTQLQNPTAATELFTQTLMKLRAWATMPPSQAAAAVLGTTEAQFTPYLQTAERLTATLSGAAGSCAGDETLSSQLVASAGLPKSFALPAGTTPAIRTAVTFALSKVGLPYLLGGIGPEAYDCSGLIMMAYKAAGIDIERTTYQQVFEGTAVYSTTELKPGDLLFLMGSDPEGDLPGHVGMYVGDGYLVQAPHTGTTVTVTPLSAWASSIVAMRRIAQ